MKYTALAAALTALSFTAPSPAQATTDPVVFAAGVMYVVSCKSTRGEMSDMDAAVTAIKLMRDRGMNPENYVDTPEVNRLARAQFQLEGCRDVP